VPDVRELDVHESDVHWELGRDAPVHRRIVRC